MLCVPASSVLVAKVAAPVPSMAALPSVAASSMNITVPVGVPAAPELTTAERVTDWPVLDGFADEVSAVMVGTFALTMRAKFCVAFPALLLALTLILSVPLAMAMPLNVAVPLPLSRKLTPPGNAPVSVIAAIGKPVVDIVKEPAVPTMKAALLVLVKAGA